MTMRLAVVVDWLTDSGGGESVCAEVLKVFPGAKVHALVDQMSEADHRRLGIPRARTSWLQAMVGVTGNYRKLLPLMPTAIRSLNLEGVDVVLAISHAVAQQAPVLAGQKLLVLSLSPMRYAWDLREQYLAESGLESGLASLAIRFVLDRLRDGDREASRRVDAYAAISHHIADRVKRAYDRESELIYPPVDTQFFTPGKSSRAPEGAYYVTASRFVPYKRVDLIVRAFVATPERRLVVIGDGPDALKVRAAASGAKNVTFVGHAGREELRDWLRGAKAFVFAAEEDFGIAPVEAQACGVPVIAYGKGGALETIVADVTGRFFNEQTVESMHEAVARFESAPGSFTPQACRTSAERFAAAKFRAALKEWVERSAGDTAPHA